MIKTIARMGVLSALALIFGYIEVLIPFHFGIPGVKLGLANLAVVVSLYVMSPREALLITAVKILASSLLFGNTASFLYALCGGLLSFFAMASAKRWLKLSITGVSILGGVFHNIGQLAVAMAVMQTLRLSYYLPILLIAGLVTGLLIGLAAAKSVALLNKTIFR